MLDRVMGRGKNGSNGADKVGLGPMFQLVAIGSLALYLGVSLATSRGRAALVDGALARGARRKDAAA